MGTIGFTGLSRTAGGEYGHEIGEDTRENLTAHSTYRLLDMLN
jgi:hypothetical protein